MSRRGTGGALYEVTWGDLASIYHPERSLPILWTQPRPIELRPLTDVERYPRTQIRVNSVDTAEGPIFRFLAELLQIAGFFTEQPHQISRLFTCHLKGGSSGACR